MEGFEVCQQHHKMHLFILLTSRVGERREKPGRAVYSYYTVRDHRNSFHSWSTLNVTVNELKVYHIFRNWNEDCNWDVLFFELPVGPHHTTK